MAKDSSFIDDDNLLNKLLSEDTIAPGTIAPRPKPTAPAGEAPASTPASRPAGGGEQADLSVLSQKVVALENELRRKEDELRKARRRDGEFAAPTPGFPPRPEDSAFQDHRAHARYLVEWRAAVVNESDSEQHIFYGRTADISMGGTSIMMSQNIYFRESVMVLLAMPPFVTGGRERIIEVRSKIMYTVLAANSQMFRVGFQFLQFRGEGKRLLENYLAERYTYF